MNKSVLVSERGRWWFLLHMTVGESIVVKDTPDSLLLLYNSMSYRHKTSTIRFTRRIIGPGQVRFWRVQ